MQNKLRRLEELLGEESKEVVLLKDIGYEDALVGVTIDNRAVYDYDKMVKHLIEKEGFESELDAIEWIDYNTLRALPYAGKNAPLIMYSLEAQNDQEK